MSSDRALVPVPASERALAPVGRRARKPHRGPRLPLRGIFLATMASTLVGSSVIGGALAWTGTEYTPEQTVGVGNVEATVTYFTNGRAVGPNDGQFREVGAGDFSNPGQINLQYLSSQFEFTGISSAPECNLGMFAGRIGTFPYTTQQMQNGRLIARAYKVELAALPAAVPQCDGATVSFKTTFTFKALGG